MNKLVFLLKLNEQDLKNNLYEKLVDYGMNPSYKDGYVYAKGTIPVMLVAHMDTVFLPPINIEFDSLNGKLYAENSGLGGDDRCGVYTILKVLEHGYRPHVLFTEEEEKGNIGATKVIKSLDRPDLKYIIEIDRRGSNDCVFYECGNESFISYIESFGFNKNYGTFTDISVLAPSWDIAAVNISCGYYNEHTKNEYIIYSEVLNNINRLENILDYYKDIDYFDYQKELMPTPDMTDEEIEEIIERMKEKRKNKLLKK